MSKLSEEFKKILNDFTTPYHNDMVSDLIGLFKNEDIESEYVEDIKNFLIHKHGAYNLEFEYDKNDCEFLQKLVNNILEEWKK